MPTHLRRPPESFSSFSSDSDSSVADRPKSAGVVTGVVTVVVTGVVTEVVTEVVT